MDDNLNKLLIKKDKLINELEVIFEQIALERMKTEKQSSKKIDKKQFEIQARNKFRIK